MINILRCFVFLNVILAFSVKARATEERPTFRSKRLGEHFKEQHKGTPFHKQSLADKHRQLVNLYDDNSSPAFARCCDVLQSSTNSSNVTKEEYVSFLRVLTNGEVNEQSFEDLELVYKTIFHSAACRIDRDCVEEPSIELANTENAISALVGLCYNVMSRSNTTVDFTFQVTVQFDPENVPQSQVGECLESATQSTLLTVFGCDTDDRRLIEEAGTIGNNQGAHREGTLPESTIEHENRIILDTSLAKWPDEEVSLNVHRILSGGGLFCAFDINTTFVSDQSFFIGCLQEPGLCGIAVLRVTIEASQLVAPDPTRLQHDATNALTRAIDGMIFGERLPPFCAGVR